jgi:DNA topoisomerase I
MEKVESLGKAEELFSPAEEIAWVFDEEPGLRRRRRGKVFVYLDANDNPVDVSTRRRIQALVIPPAWNDVWICPDPNGHIQATGRDLKGRKQYIYHPQFRQWREQQKFERILDFAEALPKIRRKVAEDLSDRRLSRTLVLATAVRVLDRTLMRIGNDEYARQNQSYGLTTPSLIISSWQADGCIFHSAAKAARFSMLSSMIVALQLSSVGSKDCRVSTFSNIWMSRKSLSALPPTT